MNRRPDIPLTDDSIQAAREAAERDREKLLCESGLEVGADGRVRAIDGVPTSANEQYA